MERKTREKRKRKKKRVEEISQDEREKIREEERRKILKELRKEKHATYSSHDSCKTLNEELCDYYEGRCHTLILSRDHCLMACNLRLTALRNLTPIVKQSVKFRDMSRVERKC